MLIHSGNEKQLFTNMIVNIFVPTDPGLLNPQFKLNDILDDEPEKLERLQYFVSGIFMMRQKRDPLSDFMSNAFINLPYL